MYVLKGEKSLSTETEIVFTVLLLLGGMKQAITNTRSVSSHNNTVKGLICFETQHQLVVHQTKFYQSNPTPFISVKCTKELF